MSVYRFSKRTQGQNNLTEHFKVWEFASHDGADEVLIDLDLVYKLEEMRRHFGQSHSHFQRIPHTVVEQKGGRSIRLFPQGRKGL